MRKGSVSTAIWLFMMFIPAFGVAVSGDRIPVVPYPQEVKIGNGHFTPSGPVISLQISGFEGNTASIIADQLSSAFAVRYDMELATGDQKNPVIWIGLPDADPRLLDITGKKGIFPGSGLGDEGYVLKIEKKNIYIVANSEAGAFYGVQTLKQLLRGHPDPLQLPALTIRDWPSIPFRCVMDDISRGPIPTNDYLKSNPAFVNGSINRANDSDGL